MSAYESTGPVDASANISTENVKGKTAIVTGGANGIGEAYVRALSKAGAYVVIADLNEEAGNKLQKEFSKTSAFVRCDVLSWNDQLNAFKKAIELSPDSEIDIVIANAGIGAGDDVF